MKKHSLLIASIAALAIGALIYVVLLNLDLLTALREPKPTPISEVQDYLKTNLYCIDQGEYCSAPLAENDLDKEGRCLIKEVSVNYQQSEYLCRCTGFCNCPPDALCNCGMPAWGCSKTL